MLNRLQVFLVITLLCFLSGNLQKATAYDGSVHMEINRHAAEQSNLNDYLEKQLCFSKGIEEIINGDEVKEWIAFGGAAEDYGIGPLWLGVGDKWYNIPCTRGYNHFHDPL